MIDSQLSTSNSLKRKVNIDITSAKKTTTPLFQIVHKLDHY